jgi:hypothetical protein
MKIDVEGSEVNLLRGAVGVLTAWRPVVIFELNPAAAATMGVPERAAWDALEALGDAFFRSSADAQLPLPAFPHVPAGTWMNVVAVHSTSGRVER